VAKPRATDHVSRITYHVSRFTFHVPHLLLPRGRPVAERH
jgi:hypothetical protein